MITTIGYGNMAPVTQLGKVITMIYAIIGIPLMLYVLSRMGSVLVRVVWTVWTRIRIYVHVKWV